VPADLPYLPYGLAAFPDLRGVDFLRFLPDPEAGQSAGSGPRRRSLLFHAGCPIWTNVAWLGSYFPGQVIKDN